MVDAAPSAWNPANVLTVLRIALVPVFVVALLWDHGQGVALRLVALGRGLTVTSEATTAAQFPGVMFRPIAGELLPFCAVWSPQNDNPALHRLLEMARSMAGIGQSQEISEFRRELLDPALLSQNPDPSQ